MSDLTPELAPEIFAACQANAEKASEAISRAFDGEFVLKAAEPVDHDPEALPSGIDGPGLAVVFTCGESGAAVLLPAAEGLLPDWLSAPDPAGASKLQALGEELGALLRPDSLAADGTRCEWVEDLAAALTRGAPVRGSKLVSIEVASGETLGQLSLVWPLQKPADFWPTSDKPAADEAAPASDARPAARPHPRDYRELPPYSVSMLQIKVPLTVTLASKRQSIDDILSLTPGAIISFDKPCDGLLELTADDQPVAVGSAVKVGERFGLRVSDIVMPDERYLKVTG
ncbi:Flagellar motor switch protein FliN [Pseudobythopirellula maris]|uniref:Flagellar motor switch protein FliN n=1 Tax=Pseudobythopirellula maris TaxID=2527991 RepID=A0A5C5ZMC0_9BACT|nr:flagellar motor switch protein FliM [Pseudobythopirellula maris]TWT88614.1 Flagellar motor switch protein FliN [Pseudobythopirellula maris]